MSTYEFRGFDADPGASRPRVTVVTSNWARLAFPLELPVIGQAAPLQEMDEAGVRPPINSPAIRKQPNASSLRFKTNFQDSRSS